MFLMCWWRYKGDLQGASGMAAFLVSSAMAVMMLVASVAMG